MAVSVTSTQNESAGLKRRFYSLVRSFAEYFAPAPDVTSTFTPHSSEKITRLLEIEKELTRVAKKFEAVRAGYLLDKNLVTVFIEIPNKADPLAMYWIKNAVFEVADKFIDFNFETNISFVYQNYSSFDYCTMLNVGQK